MVWKTNRFYENIHPWSVMKVNLEDVSSVEGIILKYLQMITVCIQQYAISVHSEWQLDL